MSAENFDKILQTLMDDRRKCEEKIAAVCSERKRSPKADGRSK